MSYSIIRSISVVKGKVYVNAASNNVCPHYYTREEIPSLTIILQEQGRDALDKEILYEYWGGMFQGGYNDYYWANRLFHIRHPEIQYANTGDKIGPAPYGNGYIKYTREHVKELALECLKEWKARDKTKKYAVQLNDGWWLMRHVRYNNIICRDRRYAKLYDLLGAQIAAHRVSAGKAPIIVEIDNAEGT